MCTPKKYVCKADSEWHNFDELPSMSVYVEFVKCNNEIVEGEIVVEPSGYYFAEGSAWTSRDYYRQWRFRPGRDYTWFNESNERALKNLKLNN